MITPYVTLESIEITPTRQAFVPDIGVLHDDTPARSPTTVLRSYGRWCLHQGNIAHLFATQSAGEPFLDYPKQQDVINDIDSVGRIKETC